MQSAIMGQLQVGAILRKSANTAGEYMRIRTMIMGPGKGKGKAD